ncbi:competence protein ComE [Thermoclostridium stercorarium subsp. thermolacticum DSM 2910]|jgi:competence protein ComEC|uniref:Competence protein ComE n=3 Tax=Thermoclostridium stercorarium TaxID=1510 RepID=A0A1B1YK44_THEST|nr:MBL fold metallo-hydrolase [Thermoclostridium stercorarium]ANW98609.1 competence protein ComE [Thermoclostridium stercorarium subsp. thermolacticum DSM 2910]ANX01150.1 competence protein ComE [Thermoclostridium stercorarium subsp. leptospartum DSM 9219]
MIINIIAILVYFFLAYATYYRSQKYNANPYIWFLIGLFLPYFGYLVALLYFRRKNAVNKNPTMLPLGFRSKRPWKMALASLFYCLLILSACAAVITENTGSQLIKDAGNTVSVNTHDNQISLEFSNTVDNNVTAQNDAELSSPGINAGNNSESEKAADGSPVSGSEATETTETGTDSTKDANGQKATDNVYGTLKVHFIDVGQADCIFVQAPEKNMLIDAGNNADGDLITAYLKNLGINKIDVVVGTHPHEDHIGALDTVINTFEVGKVYMPKISHNTKTYEDVLLAIQKKGLKVNTATAGGALDLGKNVNAEILAPNSDNYDDLNNYSVVIKLTFGETSFLFTGDAEKVSEDEMLNKNYDLKADVLKVGHHGSSSSTSPAFLKAVSPKYAVISVGKDNQYGHPDSIILNRLKVAGVKTYRTDEAGTVIMESDGNNIKINTEKGRILQNPTLTPAPTPAAKATGTPTPSPVPSTSASTQQKASETKNVTVYITKTGSKYHSDNCRYLSESKIPISLKDAKEKGYSPCSVCKPPQ